MRKRGVGEGSSELARGGSLQQEMDEEEKERYDERSSWRKHERRPSPALAPPTGRDESKKDESIG